MASFNTTTYDVSDQSFNLLNPIYINAAPETTSAKYPRNPISISGKNYYNGAFGNVMCSFAVDGGDSVLGGNVIIAGDLSCCARVAINGNTSITGNLFAASDVSFQNRLFVGQDTSLNGNLYVKNETTFQKRLFVGQDTSLNGNLYVKYDTSLNGNVTVMGNVDLAKLPTSSATPIASNALVTKTYVDNNFITTGTGPNGFSSLFTIQINNVNTTTNSNLQGPTGPTGPVGSAGAQGAQGAQGPVGTFNTSTDLALNARLFVGNGQDVSFNGNLFVLNKTILQGDVSINSRLFVGYGQDASFNGNLFVLNKTIHQGDVSINSRLFVGLDCSVNGNLQIKGRSTFSDCSFIGNTTFTNLPTSSLTPSISSQLVTKTYVDSAVSGVNTSSLLGTSNTWTNTNTWSALSTFNGNVKLPAKGIILGDLFNNMQLGDYATFGSLSTPSGSQSYQNTAVGTNTLISLTTGYVNTAIGSYALNHTTTGNNNTGVGAGALYGCTTGSRNYGIGTSAGYQMTTGNDNVWVGSQAGFGGPNTWTGSQNVGIGSNALDAATSGISNVAIGFQSGRLQSSSSYNTFIGAGSSCFSQDACSYSTAIGYNAKVSVSNQIVLGTASETVYCPNKLNVNGNLTVNGQLIGNNVSLSSGKISLTGSNINIGNGSLTNINVASGGTSNIVLGNNSGNFSSYGQNMVCIGNQIGTTTGNSTGFDGYNCTFLGYNTSGSQYGLNASNSTAIGANAQFTGSNQIMLGTASETVIAAGNLTANGQLNVQARPFTLYISNSGGGNAYIPAGSNFGTYSAVFGTPCWNQVTAYGGATAGSWNTSTGVFTAPSNGLYHFQLGVFLNETSRSGRWLQAGGTAVTGTAQYLNFNQSYLLSEGSFTISLMYYMTSGQTFYFYCQGQSPICYWANGHTCLQIIKIY